MTPPLDPLAVALARLYDLDLADDPGDLDLYLALAARADGPILELGVGSGRLAIPLAAAGWRVTGVDMDPAMLARARSKAASQDRLVAERLELIEADATTVRLPSRYRLAFVALNSLLVFGGRSAQAATIRTLVEHLDPGGLAVVGCLVARRRRPRSL